MDADPDAVVPWLATEYIAGPSLEKLVAATGPMGEPSAGVLASTLAESLAELHALNVVHRDVKPSNVLIAPDGPRLIDFGIARAADITAITHTGTVLGAPGYMSPEQALGANSGPASDVFSLAAVVVFAVIGHGPFGTTASPVAMLRRIVDEHPDLHSVPDTLRRVLEPCLAKDPASRPTAAEFAELLTDHRKQAAHWPRPGTAGWSPTSLPPRRSEWSTAVGCSGLQPWASWSRPASWSGLVAESRGRSLRAACSAGGSTFRHDTTASADPSASAGSLQAADS
ncbi:hypothetical protein BJF90_35075 [Pseudonocardia sp. CNS-004]|nr:hypothetical protein BJF90_35075 [Pseudonocardia sp. CNS-004]